MGVSETRSEEDSLKYNGFEDVLKKLRNSIRKSTGPDGIQRVYFLLTLKTQNHQIVEKVFFMIFRL